MKLIVAANTDGVIGIDNKIPWKKSEDLKRFKEKTMGSTLVMGRKTWESLGCKDLPGRKSIVFSKTKQNNVETVSSFEEIIEKHRDHKNFYVIGGGEIYEKSIPYISEIDLTIVTDFQTHIEDVVKFKYLSDHGLLDFEMVESQVNPNDQTLIHYKYVREYTTT